MSSALTTPVERHNSGVPRLALAAYGLLGAALIATRAIGIDRSYWHDEILTVRLFVRQGPYEILFGAYFANNHPLFSLLGWATTGGSGHPEWLMRLCSIVPFILGVALVTAWLHRRAGPWPAVVFLFLSTTAPLLLDITRQARGYGLAFLAMGFS